MPSTKGFCARNSLKNVCSMPRSRNRGGRLDRTLPGSSLSKLPRQNLPHPVGMLRPQSAAREKLRYPDGKKPPDHTTQSKDGWDSCNSCHRERQEAAPRAMPPMAYARRYSSTLSASTRTTSFSPSYETLRHAAFTQAVYSSSILQELQTYGRDIDPHPAWRPHSTAPGLSSAWLPFAASGNHHAPPDFSLNFLASATCPEAIRS